jgi:hypothetical protein
MVDRVTVWHPATHSINNPKMKQKNVRMFMVLKWPRA